MSFRGKRSNFMAAYCGIVGASFRHCEILRSPIDSSTREQNYECSAHDPIIAGTICRCWLRTRLTEQPSGVTGGRRGQSLLCEPSNTPPVNSDYQRFRKRRIFKILGCETLVM